MMSIQAATMVKSRKVYSIFLYEIQKNFGEHSARKYNNWKENRDVGEMLGRFCFNADFGKWERNI